MFSAYILSTDAALIQLLEKFVLTITTLSASSLVKLDSQPPTEDVLTVLTISEACQVYLIYKVSSY